MRVGTLNAHDQLRPVTRALSGRRLSLLLVQEHPVLDDPSWRMGAGYGFAAGGDGQCQTLWDSHTWQLVERRWHKAHDGRRRVTPARGTLVVKLRHRVSGHIVAVVNEHRINAYPWRSHYAWRRARWAEHDRLTRGVVAALAAEQLPVVGGGDYNRRKVPAMHPRLRWLQPAGIDKLWTVDGRDYRLQLAGAASRRDVGSDHALRTVPLQVWQP